jgi:hypothetical protein
MSPDRMSATSVAHKSTGGTLQSLPEPVDPVGDAPDYLTFKTVAPARVDLSDNPVFVEPTKRRHYRYRFAPTLWRMVQSKANHYLVKNSLFNRENTGNFCFCGLRMSLRLSKKRRASKCFSSKFPTQRNREF